MMLARLLSEVYRALPIKGGQTRLSFNRFVNWLMKDFRDPISARLWDGREIMVDPHDYHGRILFLFGTNDIKVALNSALFLRTGDVFLDIGANYSTIGLHASHVVGPTGAVHLFEPQHGIAERVDQAIRKGPYPNVTLHRCGLLDVDATLTIRAPLNHSGRATFAAHAAAAEFERSETCAVHEIGAYVAPLVNGRPFGVKLDIEGSEPRVLPWLLGQPSLKFVIFEANHHLDTLFTLVSQSALTLFGLERSALRLRLGRIDAAGDMLRYHDLIALRMVDGFVAPERIDSRALVGHLARP